MSIIAGLKHLSEEEIEILCMAPVWVSLLVAGADEKVDNKEIREAITLARDKQQAGNSVIRELYKRSNRNFENNLRGYMALFSENGAARQEYLLSQLSSLNQVLAKLERQLAVEYYKSLKEFSARVANASGGIFGFGAITKEEEALLDLPMIDDPSQSGK